MKRVAPIDPAELDQRGQEIYKAIAGPRQGTVDGPFRAWLRGNPELAARVNDVGNALRVNGKLDKRLFEVAVLCVARFWNAHYQWAAHRPLAIELGLAPDVVDAIGAGAYPKTARDDEKLVFDLANGLLERRAIPADVYDAVLAQIGFEQMVELVTTIGQYSLAAIVVNGFEIGSLTSDVRLPDRG